MSHDYMNRRKVRGLTKLGRMVSEDPDIDNLLSNLSPEELEEVEKEVMKVPGPDPGEVTLMDQTDSQSSTTTNSRGAKSDPAGGDSKKSLQRNMSVESRPSRKQEYLLKMGWSQEKKEAGGIQRQDNVSCSRDNKTESSRTSRGPTATTATDGQREERRRCREDSKDTEAKGERGRESDGKPMERKDGGARESIGGSSSKTKDLISKLQEKKEDSRQEKDKKEDVRKRDDSKMKGLISRLEEKEKQEKEESKEKLRKEEIRRRDISKTKGLVSKLEEKQSPNEVDKTEERKQSEQKDKTEIQSEGTKDDEGEKEEVKKDGQRKEEKNKGMENEGKVKENINGEEVKQKASVNDNGKGDEEEKMEKSVGNTPKSSPSKKEDVENCVAAKTPKAKTKEEEEEEESASMFDDSLQSVRSNDPNMTELNVNNSEVIKAKTLIQFAEALRDNTHIKTFALANCRADDHVAYAIAGTLRVNKALTSINLDSNLLTSKGIMSLVQALQHNATLTELRFHNQRHICGGKTEMEMTKLLKENTTLLKLGYHFELAGPRMTMTNILSRNMDRQRQRRLQEQKQAQAQAQANGGGQKGALEVPKATGAGGFRSPKASPKPSPQPSPMPSPKMTPKKGGKGPAGGPAGPGGPPPPPPPPPPAPMLDGDFLKNSLTPVSQRKLEDRTGGKGASKNSRDQLLASIRGSNIKQLKKVELPKLLQ